MRVEKGQYYKPIDKNYRGGRKAIITRVDRANNVVHYATGGQEFQWDLDRFLEHYKLTDGWINED
jgi:hypothetical protein